MNDALPDVATIPTILRTVGWSDYAMIDSGSGRKLERFGPYHVIRPEPQCLWLPQRPERDWDSADAVFDPTDEDEAGRWRFSRPLDDAWTMSWREVKYLGRFTAFRHLAF